MSAWWDKQIHRADQLIPKANGSKELLKFYAQLLRAQKDIHEFLRSRKNWLPSGNLEVDLPILNEALPSFLRVIEAHGPAALASEARDLSQAGSQVVAERLLAYWASASDTQFFEKAFLQPYLRWAAESGAQPIGREVLAGERFCPFCGGNPQVSFLQNK